MSNLPSKRAQRLSISHGTVQSPENFVIELAERDLRYSLPDRHLADSLVDEFFDFYNSLYPFIHEPSFRAKYERMWDTRSDSNFRPSWYAVLNAVFAHGCEFSKVLPGEEHSDTPAHFVTQSRDIVFSHVLKNGSLEFVQALLLLCHHLQGSLYLNECWSLAGLMIQTAVSIGLHLNPDELNLGTVEKETRKRVWWGCFIFDRTLSMKFGRPPLMQAARFDIPLPLAVDDQYIHNNSSTPRQPAGHPSTIPFFNHNIRLSQVIDHILQDLYLASRKISPDSLLPSGSRQSYILGHAVLLDGELQSWWNDVPRHIRPETNIPEGHIFQRQQNVTYIRYLQIRVLLQRQLLMIFSREEIKDDFFRSVAIAGSRACISAAQETIRLIYTKYHRRQLNSLCYNLHYIFVSMGVLLHLHTMDKAKLQLLCFEPENGALELGMEFLKMASKSSTLAAKYIALIQRVRAQIQIKQKNSQMDNSSSGISCMNEGSNDNTIGEGVTYMPERDGLDDDMQSFLNSIEMAATGMGDPASFAGDFDMDFMNLFGMGLSQDVVLF
ncbi:fungal-specific transcription factor domain-containing protein [Xylogone sp. PMI_703]|nr:fungal-specific transcription factor domain-containing protein [Xylogone sp. PMI_703]